MITGWHTNVNQLTYKFFGVIYRFMKWMARKNGEQRKIKEHGNPHWRGLPGAFVCRMRLRLYVRMKTAASAKKGEGKIRES